MQHPRLQHHGKALIHGDAAQNTDVTFLDLIQSFPTVVSTIASFTPPLPTAWRTRQS